MPRSLKISVLVLALIILGLVKACNAIFSPIFTTITVSDKDDTTLEAELHWTGAFSGSQHDEFLVYFVQDHWFSSPERKLLCSREGYSGDFVRFRRVDDTTIEFVRYQTHDRQVDTTASEVLMRFSFSGPFPTANSSCNVQE